MFRHCVMMKWTDESTDDQRRAASEALATLPSLVPSIRAYSFGSDAGLADTNFDFVVVGDFDDRDGYIAYSKHADHVAVIEQYLKPIIAVRSAVQYEIEG